MPHILPIIQQIAVALYRRLIIDTPRSSSISPGWCAVCIYNCPGYSVRYDMCPKLLPPCFCGAQYISPIYHLPYILPLCNSRAIEYQALYQHAHMLRGTPASHAVVRSSGGVVRYFSPCMIGLVQSLPLPI